ncbi:MAG: PEP-utilizing enzyme [Candidatus Kerfeldbacteria bacterium]
MSTPSLLISARNVTKTYHLGQVSVRALQDVSLDINEGDFVIITGRNGAGKSTLMHNLAVMKKAAAFVTDEGGLTCHAAIVAREMHKPCIVGTKHATHALKNGDLVEVDANRGLVKKV